MKKIFISMLALVISLGGAIRAAGTETELSLDVMSSYVFRGLTFNDGMVFQPALDVYLDGLGFNVWANMDIDDYDGAVESGEFSEVDLTVYYAASLQGIQWSVYYTEFLYPHAVDENGEAVDGDREIGAAVSFPFGRVTPELVAAYDIDEKEDIYLQANTTYRVKFSEKISSNIKAGVGYVGDDLSVLGEAGWHELDLSVNTVFDIKPDLSLSALLAYTDSLDHDVLPEQEVDLYGGLSLTTRF